MRKENNLKILETHLHDFVDMCAYPEEEVIFQQDGKGVAYWEHF